MAIQDFNAQKQDYFKKRREEAGQQANQATQEASDAITRRFAALGAQGSGAAIGAQLKAKEMGEAQKQKAISDVNAQEVQTNMAEAEAEKGRQFQRELAGQDLAMKKDVFGFEKESKLKEMELAKQQMDLDTATTEFNKNLALHIQGIKQYGDTATQLEAKNKAYEEALAQLRKDYIQNVGLAGGGMDKTELNKYAKYLFPNQGAQGFAGNFDTLTNEQQTQVLNHIKSIQGKKPETIDFSNVRYGG